MDPDDRVPVLLGHVEDHAVAQDAGDVDQDVEAPIGVDRLVDDPLGGVMVGDVVGVDGGLAAGLADLLDHLLGRRLVLPSSVQGHPEVVHDHLGGPRRRRSPGRPR